MPTLDIPVGIHVGPGPPGAAYLGMNHYRMSLTDPLLLESVLVDHPHLRLYLMQAGWPMIDCMIALLYARPQVYVDTGVIGPALESIESASFLTPGQKRDILYNNAARFLRRRGLQ